MTKPIRPEEILHVLKESIPDQVFEAFNELIVEDFSNGKAIVTQKEVVAKIVSKMKSISSDEILKKTLAVY